MGTNVDRLRTEVAHVLFLDMVGYSRLSLEEQARVAYDLRELVRGTPEFVRCDAAGDLLRSDTGDGMALVFFTDPHSPIRCACQIAAALGRPARHPLRIGLHSGPVIRTRDINGRENVSGGGVNLAQRVMDCGDAGHILLSRHYADLLASHSDWTSGLYDLGEVSVKHGIKLSLVSFYQDGCGSAALPRALSSLTAPTNLPFWRTDQFVGRTPTLALVHDLLQAAAPVVLAGLSGLGKTQLALHYAHLFYSEYPGGVFWINAADSSHLKEDYATLGRSFFGIPETLSLESSVARLRDRLNHLAQPSLFVFDNITEDTDLALLPVSAQCRLLLTTQKKNLVPPGFKLVELPKLEADAALALLQGPEPRLSDDECIAAKQIAEAVGRLPLALALVAQHRQRLRVGFAEYRRRFLTADTADCPEEQKLLTVLERAREKFVAATGHKGRIYETIQRSYLSLDPAAQTVLAAASCFAPAGIGRDLLFAVLGPDAETDGDEALADLADASLIAEDELSPDPQADPDPAPRLRLHELVRLFARIQLTEEQHRHYVSRLASVLTERLQSANEHLDWRDTRPEMAHLAWAITETRRQELWESLFSLLNVFGEHLILHREYAAAEATLGEGLQVAARLYGPLHESRARLLRLLGQVDRGKDDLPNALRNVRAAVHIARRVYPSGHHALAEYFAALGYILKEKGQFRRAEVFLQKTLDLCLLRSGPDHPTVALCRNNLAMALSKQGRLQEAETHLRAALETESRREARGGPTAAMSIYWNNLGKVLRDQGRWSEALAYYESALQNNRRIHGLHHTDVASSLYLTAVAYDALHQENEARAYYQEALALYKQLYGEDNWRCDVVRKNLAELPAL
jgi:tetratricopeptide (TPR) repeat protein